MVLGRREMRIIKIIFLLLPLFFFTHFIMGEDKKFEIEIYGNLNLPSFKGEYSYIYSPPFSPGAYLSFSELSLNYKVKSKNGFGVGFNYFFFGNFGIRLDVSYFKTAVEGESSKYKIFLQYVSMQPPSYTPRLFSLEREIDWKPVGGNFTRFNSSIDFIYKLRMKNGIRAELMAGFSHESSKLDLKSIGFTKFWLGGHSVLFSENYQIELSSGFIRDFGLSGEGELSLPLGEYLDLAFGVRYFYFPVRFASVELLVQKDMDLETLKLIKEFMKLPLIQFPNSHYSLITSLRFKF